MISPVPGGRRRRRSRVTALGLVAAAGLLTVAVQEATTASAAPTPGTLVVSAPFTSSNDYITGIPDCTPPASKTLGPMGLLDVDGRFLVTDDCNYTTYLYTPGATSATPVTSKQNGLSIGLALDNGVYYGVAGSSHIVANGVYTFDPDTLELGRKIIDIPCNGDPRDLAADPATGDLFLTTKCGLYRITGLSGSSPQWVRIGSALPNLDGIVVVDGGKHVWVANVGTSVDEYDTSSGDVVQSVALPNGRDPDGLAVAGPGAPAGIAGNLFVNSNDGTITMIDVHNGNATSVVATGGTRGDFVTVDSNGVLYVTQSDRVVQLHPGFLLTNPTGGSPTKPTSSSSSSSHPSSPSSSKSSSSSSSSPATHSSSSSSSPSTTPTGTPTSTAATTAATVAPTDGDTGAGLPRTGAGLTTPLLLTGITALLLGTLIVLWTRRQRALNSGDHE